VHISCNAEIHAARSQQQQTQAQGGSQAGSQTVRNFQQRIPAGGQQEAQWTVRSSSNMLPSHTVAGQSQAPQVGGCIISQAKG